MKLVDVVTEKKVRELATPSNLKHGKEIFGYDRIETVEKKNDYAIYKVKVPTGQTRRVELELVPPEDFTWKCSCAGEQETFCKHCVAAALTFIHDEEAAHS